MAQAWPGARVQTRAKRWKHKMIYALLFDAYLRVTPVRLARRGGVHLGGPPEGGGGQRLTRPAGGGGPGAG